MRSIAFIYVMYFKSWRPSRLWLFKFGFSDEVEARRANIEKTVSEKSNREEDVKVFIALPLLSARLAERFFHSNIGRKFRSNRIPKKSSGYTEWMDWPNVITAIFFWLIVGPEISRLTGIREANAVLSLLIAAIPRPIDLSLILAGIMYLELTVINYVIDVFFGVNFITSIARFMGNVIDFLI